MEVLLGEKALLGEGAGLDVVLECGLAVGERWAGPGCAPILLRTPTPLPLSKVSGT